MRHHCAYRYMSDTSDNPTTVRVEDDLTQVLSFRARVLHMERNN